MITHIFSIFNAFRICTTLVENLEILLSKHNDDLSPASPCTAWCSGLRSSPQSTQREHFLFGGEIPPNKKGSALLESLLVESQRILRRIGVNPEPQVVRGISPILLKQILPCDLCALCERHSAIWLRLCCAV